MRLPIDTSGMTFLAAGPPEQVVNFDTKAVKVDDSGQPIFAVQIVALVEGGAEVLAVKVAGEPKGITKGGSVNLVGLVAQPWSMDGRSGVAFRAVKIETSGSGRAAS